MISTVVGGEGLQKHKNSWMAVRGCGELPDRPISGKKEVINRQQQQQQQQWGRGSYKIFLSGLGRLIKK